jgi:trk system potassium uptake protein TrkH
LDFFIGAVSFLAFLLLMVQLSGHWKQYAHFFQLANLGILGLFIFDVIASFVFSPRKKAHVRSHWFDLIVFIPLILLVRGVRESQFYLIVWQAAIVVMLTSRIRRAGRFVSMLGLKPAQLMFASFASAIGVGSTLLMLPAATTSGTGASLVDALFTSTSAVCVTGLIVRDTATYYTTFGQFVILGLIQVGALGILTFSVSLAILVKRRVEMQRQLEMQEVLDQDTLSSIRELITFIVSMTFAFELAGAAALFFAWRGNFASDATTAFHAVFHSVSAFCNAGFSTFTDSLTGFRSDIATNAIIIVLISFGGFGFTVVRDLLVNFRECHLRRSRRVISLRVQTKIVLLVSFILVAAGAIFFYFVERNASLAGLGLVDRVTISIFQSVTARTAGFNTCDFGTLSAPILMIFIILMFIGASPGSTGGGVKTTTIAVLWAVITSGLRKSPHVQLYRRTIPNEIIHKALSVFIISLFLVLAFCLVILYLEPLPFASLVFETVSAFGTVGLSTGVTGQLSPAGKITITILMFIGRLGPLTIAYTFLRMRKMADYRYAEERVMIG